MEKIGHDITKHELDDIMKQHDLMHNNIITFYEFKAMVLDLNDVQKAKDYQLSDSHMTKTGDCEHD